jgi:hypothetical protein
VEQVSGIHRRKGCYCWHCRPGSQLDVHGKQAGHEAVKMLSTALPAPPPRELVLVAGACILLCTSWSAWQHAHAYLVPVMSCRVAAHQHCCDGLLLAAPTQVAYRANTARTCSISTRERRTLTRLPSTTHCSWPAGFLLTQSTAKH